jgi:hypothetical protein
MYERVAVHGERDTNLPVEYEAFGKVLEKRATIDEDRSGAAALQVFRLYDLVMPLSTPNSLVVLHNRHQHHRLGCAMTDARTDSVIVHTYSGLTQYFGVLELQFGVPPVLVTIASDRFV